MASPICEVQDGSDPFQSTTNGANVTPSNTVTIRLASTAGVGAWSISCFATDELSDAEDITESLVVDAVAKTATFTAPASGRALLFRSTVNHGLGADNQPDQAMTTTFGVYTPVAGRRCHAVGETFESNATFGHTGDLNSVIRDPSGTTPTGTGFRHVTSGSEDGAAKLVENADVHASAAIALSKLAAGGSDGNVVRQAGGAIALGTIDLSDADAVGSSVLDPANGGTGQDWSAGSGIPKFVGGAASLVSAPSGVIVGTTDSQTLENKTLTSPTINGGTISNPTISAPTLSGTVTYSGTSMQATGNARARAYSDIANVQTTDATVTSLFTWTVLDEATTQVLARVGASNSTGASSNSYVRMVNMKRDGGTVTVGSVGTPFTHEDQSGWDCTIDQSGGTGRLRVTGGAATTIDWGGVIDRLEVSHA